MFPCNLFIFTTTERFYVSLMDDINNAAKQKATKPTTKGYDFSYPQVFFKTQEEKITSPVYLQYLVFFIAS